MQNIIVAGGAGYIGSHMVKMLSSAGFNPVTVDNLSTGHRDSVLYGDFEECDIADSVRMGRIFEEYNPAAVIHFAAFSLVGESVSKPDKYYRNNVSGTLSLLDTMRRHACDRFIFSSTAAVFGNPEYLPIDELHPKTPVNPYGRTKLMTEQALGDYAEAYGLRYVIFRYFNAAGHDESGDLKERHSPETHLLPLVVQAAKGERSHIALYGDDYDTPDGTCVRDYIHVNDLCAAHLAGIKYLENGGEPADFNLGNGNGFSVKEIIDKVRLVSGTDFEVKTEGRRAGDPASLVADSSKARHVLGWQPEYTDIEDIIKTVWKTV
ncbi:MAG: UDP-glucose 4-epimerase GalE [Geovibrio sp.]|uniref:UDP-glucose 4-epimerase GalE n=1 Tax=Geovibrio ferrireducens TaxID=46201 RepID=UPI002246884E|nr:UDP-glucose 4-epimerase GalE [Geovibrio ferrireducens]MCD8492646.1 UDP-glucose 4-epimerase GalE [Geovibrio sp.]